MIEMENQMKKAVTMDIRKVVKLINESTQSEARLIGQMVKRLGEKSSKNYELVSISKDNVLFEDSIKNQYYIAKYRRDKGGHYVLHNINPITIVESKKELIFNDLCKELVNVISEGKEKEADLVFNKLEKCRFRSTVAKGGIVYTRDGMRRKLYSTGVIQESKDHYGKIITKALTEKIFTDKDRSSAVLIESNQNIFIPNIALTKKRNLAKKMKTIAESAYRSPKFQNFVKSAASKVTRRDAKAVIIESAKFFDNYQEFSMLNLSEMTTLVENTLASVGIFNPAISADTAYLLYRSNLSSNRDQIINVWEEVAKATSDIVILESVKTLSEQEKIEDYYDKFLSVVLNESSEDDELMVKFLATIINIMQKIVDEKEEEVGDKEEMGDTIASAIKEDVDEEIGSDKITDVLEKLKDLYEKVKDQSNRDTASMHEVKEVLASVNSDAIAPDSSTIGDFDSEKSVDGVDEEDVPAMGEALETDEENPNLGGEEGEGGVSSGDLGLDLGSDLGGGEEEEGGLDLGDLGEEGEEKKGEEGEKKEPDLELPESIQTPVNQVKVLKEELDQIRSNVDKFYQTKGQDEAVKYLRDKIQLAEGIDMPELAEMFSRLIQEDYEFNTTTDKIDINYGIEEEIATADDYSEGNESKPEESAENKELESTEENLDESVKATVTIESDDPEEFSEVMEKVLGSMEDVEDVEVNTNPDEEDFEGEEGEEQEPEEKTNVNGKVLFATPNTIMSESKTLAKKPTFNNGPFKTI